MIYITNEKFSINYNKFKKICPFYVKVSTEALKENKVHFEEKRNSDKGHKNIYDIVIDYMNETIKKSQSNNGLIKCNWDYDNKNKMLIQTMDKLYTMKQIGFDITNYMYTFDDKLVEINVMKLLDIMAADTSFLDLGYASYEIDRELNNRGYKISSTLDCSVLFDIMEDSMFNSLYPLKILENDNVYNSEDGTYQMSVFNTEHKMSTNTYAEFLQYNANQLMTYIIFKYIDKLKNEGTDKVNFIGYMETSIYFKIKTSAEDIIKSVFDQEYITKAFGRFVKVRPLIRTI